MYAIEKTFSFSAAHVLEGLCNDHPCGSFHGHNYDLTIRIESESLDSNGFIIDFNDLKKFKDEVIDKFFDHATITTQKYRRFITNLLDCGPAAIYKKIYSLPDIYENTTVENMCEHIHHLLVEYFEKIKFTNYQNIIINMSETNSSVGEYTPTKISLAEQIMNLENRISKYEHLFDRGAPHNAFISRDEYVYKAFESMKEEYKNLKNRVDVLENPLKEIDVSIIFNILKVIFNSVEMSPSQQIYITKIVADCIAIIGKKNVENTQR